MTNNRVLILGGTGQDGKILGGILTRFGSTVGLVSRFASRNPPLPLDMSPRFFSCDIRDRRGLALLLGSFRPNLVANLAGASHVNQSWTQSTRSQETNQDAIIGLSEELEKYQQSAEYSVTLYHQSSSEIFGNPQESPQTESTPFRPITPYGEHKARAHEYLLSRALEVGYQTIIGVTYNHESVFRPPTYLSRKISLAVALQSLAGNGLLQLGNAESRRDFGWAPEYMELVARMMLEGTREREYVISTGTTTSVREMADFGFEAARIPKRKRSLEFGSNRREVDPQRLVGDSSRVRKEFGWAPKVGAREILQRMVETDVRRLQRVSLSFQS